MPQHPQPEHLQLRAGLHLHLPQQRARQRGEPEQPRAGVRDHAAVRAGACRQDDPPEPGPGRPQHATDQRAANARHAARGLLHPGHLRLLQPRLPVLRHLAQHRGVVAAAGAGPLHRPQRSQGPQHPRGVQPRAPTIRDPARHHKISRRRK